MHISVLLVPGVMGSSALGLLDVLQAEEPAEVEREERHDQQHDHSHQRELVAFHRRLSSWPFGRANPARPYGRNTRQAATIRVIVVNPHSAANP